MDISKLLSSSETINSELKRLASLIMDHQLTIEKRMYYFARFDLLYSYLVENDVKQAPRALANMVEFESGLSKLME